MPLYDYEHTTRIGATCEKQFEASHSIHETLERCPTCGEPVRKVVSACAVTRNIFASSNLKEKGFKRLVRRDKGVYEEG